MLFALPCATKANPQLPVGNAALTPRQKECLELWTIGKTAQDISEILKIKLRTVIWHIENAKLKLGAQTISQATPGAPTPLSVYRAVGLRKQ